MTDQYQALVLCNYSEIIPLLNSQEFSNMIHILKLKYFHGTIESPKRNRRTTVRDRRLGFSTNLKDTISNTNIIDHNPLGEPLIEDSFSDNMSFEDMACNSRSSRSYSQAINLKRLHLIKDHEDFETSINNSELMLIVEMSIK